MDFYGFYTGQIFDAYQYLGAHLDNGPEGGVTFRVFAPAAHRIAVIGEFSGWNEVELHKVHDGNFWECYSAQARPGQMYKYRIYSSAGMVEHCDPYGFGMELRPGSASIIRDIREYAFYDEVWMKTRTDHKDKPLNIYEIHAGSFRKPEDKPDSWYNYEELAELLVPYLKENGYNCVELMPLNEYPSDESWGYQATGFFSPTSRFGTATQLKAFVDRCHRAGIAVVQDYVPVHFAVDGYALANFDGTALYEYPHAAVGRSEWGSCNFMHSRGEVRSFLQSAANYWLSEYHMDGIRMDAISRIIYWQGDPNRGVNKNAVDFIRFMNKGLKAMHPACMLFAEDSTSFPDTTKPAAEGGLGFDYKWDMGWMNDTLNYFRTAPEYRSDNYHKLTFSMMYYYNEKYLLPLSHDETVHGKATILQKMAGDYDDKFPQARAFYLYMMTHPGKKLNFMGNEIGQLREWDEKREQDWFMTKYPNHDAFHRFMMDLNKAYLSHAALSAADFAPEGFEWLDCHQESRCIYAIKRACIGESVVAVFNFSNQPQSYTLKVPGAAALEPLLDTEFDIYGGSKPVSRALVQGKDESFTFELERYSARLYQVKGLPPKEEKPAAPAK